MIDLVTPYLKTALERAQYARLGASRRADHKIQRRKNADLVKRALKGKKDD